MQSVCSAVFPEECAAGANLIRYHARWAYIPHRRWEDRKGWKYLVEAFEKEFSLHEGVALYILTNKFRSDGQYLLHVEE